MRGHIASICENHASCQETFREQRNTRLVTGNEPSLLSQPPPPNHPKGDDSGGEELTQGGVRSSYSALCPGLISDALLGRSKEAAASCRCSLKNVQSSGARRAGEGGQLSFFMPPAVEKKDKLSSTTIGSAKQTRRLSSRNQ